MRHSTPYTASPTLVLHCTPEKILSSVRSVTLILRTGLICLSKLQEIAAQQRALLRAASKAGLLHKVTVADAQQVLDHAQPAQLLQELAAGPVPAADVFLSEPFYASLESLPPTTQLRWASVAVCAE